MLNIGKKGKAKRIFKPRHGNEYFFSNVMVKVQQISRLFLDPSDQLMPETSSFIVLVFEKTTRKRSTAKSETQHQRLKKINILKRDEPNNQRFEDLQWLLRDAKMRRFCNYFLTLYDVKNLEPFFQFMKQKEIEDIKELIIDKCNNFLERHQKSLKSEMRKSITIVEYRDSDE